MSKEKIEYMNPEFIFPDPNQPRTVFDETEIEELAATYKEQGVINPIEIDDFNIIVLGERRWRGAKLAKLELVPVKRKSGLNPRVRLERQLIDDAQRKNLNDIERAWAYATAVININQEVNTTNGEIPRIYTLPEVKAINKEHLINLLDAKKGGPNGTIKQGTAELARRIALNQSTVQKYISLLKLSPKMQEAIEEGKVPQTYVREIARIAEEQPEVAEKLEDQVLLDFEEEKREDRVIKTADELQEIIGDEDILELLEEPDTTVENVKQQIEEKQREELVAEVKEDVKEEIKEELKSDIEFVQEAIEHQATSLLEDIVGTSDRPNVPFTRQTYSYIDDIFYKIRGIGIPTMVGLGPEGWNRVLPRIRAIVEWGQFLISLDPARDTQPSAPEIKDIDQAKVIEVEYTVEEE